MTSTDQEIQTSITEKSELNPNAIEFKSHKSVDVNFNMTAYSKSEFEKFYESNMFLQSRNYDNTLSEHDSQIHGANHILISENEKHDFVKCPGITRAMGRNTKTYRRKETQKREVVKTQMVVYDENVNARVSQSKNTTYLNGKVNSVDSKNFNKKAFNQLNNSKINNDLPCNMFCLVLSAFVILGINHCSVLASMRMEGEKKNSVNSQSSKKTSSNFKINDGDPFTVLKLLKAKNVDRPIIAHLNINFLEQKFEPLKLLIKDNVDILLVSETKIDDTFPLDQFLIEGYSKPIRLDRNSHGGGIIFFI